MPSFFSFRSLKRIYLTLLVLLPCASLLAACGESNKVFEVGIYNDTPGFVARLDGLKDGLKSLGYVEGTNIDYHTLNPANLASNQQTAALTNFVSKNYNAYVVVSAISAQKLKQAGETQPLLVLGLVDGVNNKLIQSLDHPGTNVTGIDSLNTALSTKRLQWLARFDPTIHQAYLLYNPQTLAETDQLPAMRSEAATLGITLIEKTAVTPSDVKQVLASLKAVEAPALLTVGALVFSAAGDNLKTMVEREKIVVVGGQSSHLGQDALFSYGANDFALGRQGATYLDNILHGSDPAILPVVPADKLELVLNQKLADQLGLKFPPVMTEAADNIVTN